MKLTELYLKPENIDISVYEKRPIYKSVISYMRKSGANDHAIRICIAEFENSPTREISLKIFEDMAQKFYNVLNK